MVLSFMFCRPTSLELLQVRPIPKGKLLELVMAALFTNSVKALKEAL